MDNKLEEITLPGGGSSSQCPPYELIPSEALDALALRLGRGLRRKGDKSWNGLNRKTVLTKEFVLNRLGHCLKHTMLAIERVSERIPNDPEEMADGGDAGAILWAGAMLAAYEQQKEKNDTPIVYRCDTGQCIVCSQQISVAQFDDHARMHRERTNDIVYYILNR